MMLAGAPVLMVRWPHGPRRWRAGATSPDQGANSFMTSWRSCAWGRLVYFSHELWWSVLPTSGPYRVSISMTRVTFVLLYLSFPSLASCWWSLLA